MGLVHGRVCLGFILYSRPQMYFYKLTLKNTQASIEFYKYVLIDKSTTLKVIPRSITELLKQICQNKSVILVSATPYNNPLEDIYNQFEISSLLATVPFPVYHESRNIFGYAAKATL